LASESEIEIMRANYLGGNYGYGHAKQALYELILAKFTAERKKFDELMAATSKIDDMSYRNYKLMTLISTSIVGRHDIQICSFNDEMKQWINKIHQRKVGINDIVEEQIREEIPRNIINSGNYLGDMMNDLNNQNNINNLNNNNNNNNEISNNNDNINNESNNNNNNNEANNNDVVLFSSLLVQRGKVNERTLMMKKREKEKNIRYKLHHANMSLITLDIT
jgi:hypothetical protein